MTVGNEEGRGTTVRFFFQDEEEPESSFWVREGFITLRQLRRAFPFHGRFHFRARCPLPSALSGADGGGERKAAFGWFDLTDDGEPVPQEGGVIRLKVLSRPYRATAEENLTEEESAPLDEPPLAPPEAGAAKRSSMIYSSAAAALGSVAEEGQKKLAAAAKGVAKVGSWLSNFSKKASASFAAGDSQAAPQQMLDDGGGGNNDGGGGGGSSSSSSSSSSSAGEHSRARGPALPSEAARAELARLGSAFRADPKGHDSVSLLQDAWAVLGPAMHHPHAAPDAAPPPPFALDSPDWQALGFSPGDPRASLRGGTLPLQCLAYFVAEYPRSARGIVAAQATEEGKAEAAKRGGCCYPLGAVAVNVTLMLADLVLLRENKYLGTARPFWGVLEGPGAFFEIYSIALRLLDATWTQSNAPPSRRREEFKDVISRTKTRMQELMESGPQTMEELFDTAGRMGILV